MLSPILLLSIIIWLVFLVVSYPFIVVYELWLKYRFWWRHGKFGRFVLFVYSDSPNWKDYIEANILPRIERNAVILNWSKRGEWSKINPFEATLFNHWAGRTEFNPMALIFSPSGKVKDVRFWSAFKEFKHGKHKSLREAENNLFAEIEEFRSKET